MNQTTILLDGAQGLIIIPLFFIGHLILTLLVEGFVLYKFSFAKLRSSIFAALEANLISLIIGMFLYIPLFNLFDSTGGSESAGSTDPTPYVIGILFLLTLLLEFAYLAWKNKVYSRKKLLLAVVLMNILTYSVLLYLI